MCEDYVLTIVLYEGCVGVKTVVLCCATAVLYRPMQRETLECCATVVESGPAR